MALDARKERGEYKDADGDFVRATNCVTVTASGSVCVVTAGAKALGPYGGPGTGMEKWLAGKLKEWEALPEAERAPGAVKVPAVEAVDPKRAALALPPGTMIVRVFNRHLGWDQDKALRYVIADDYPPNTNKSSVERYAMAQNDFMWIPEKEWRAIVPAEPTKGASFAAPKSFALRLFRYHLDPCRGFSEGAAFQNSKADAGQLTLTVQEVSPAKIGLRLEGVAKLQQPGREGPASYEPMILGFLEYDRSKKIFTRFDLLAVGTTVNLPTDANGVVAFRKGPYPLGIAFELVADPTPAERLHPRGARDNPAAYLEPKDK
ncbi:hypothetical protein AYO44_14110 [Planctomycetaceae bacterium SCGC AG-212-F19]|nr:hypothetical protein AYO44_14110 [Planctomycetaceae bacterium SCGC AG-212-F19]